MSKGTRTPIRDSMCFELALKICQGVRPVSAMTRKNKYTQVPEILYLIHLPRNPIIRAYTSQILYQSVKAF